MSYIKIQCNNCDKIHQIDAKEIDFEQIGSDARQMGVEITYKGNVEIQCNCGQNIEINHLFWEYPQDVENDKETEVSGGIIVENTL
ncbi:hypothetical protein [Nitrosomonas sp.]|uniref:hypothetical protein n=1 Tax=Nitrosomonas sp. TaxID=42353 RepID=UPI0037C7B95F